MPALTLDEYLAQTGDLEAFTARDAEGREVTLELKHPTRADAERIVAIITSETLGLAAMRQVEFAAIEACVEGATAENSPRIQQLGGDALRDRLFDLIGLPKAAAVEEAEEVGNSPSETT